jgi:hypothetical protein
MKSTTLLRLSVAFLSVLVAGLPLSCGKVKTKVDGPGFNISEKVLQRSEMELAHSMAEITYLGLQTKSIPSIFFKTDWPDGTVVLFEKIQHRRSYRNDGRGQRADFLVTAKEMRTMLNGIGKLVYQAQFPDADGFVSFSVLRESGGAYEGCELFIGHDERTKFYETLLASLDPKNETGRKRIKFQFNNVVPSSHRKHVEEK